MREGEWVCEGESEWVCEGESEWVCEGESRSHNGDDCAAS